MIAACGKQPGWVDLHCHCLPAIDDGVRTVEEGVALLQELAALGFSTVVATPHMRPGLFDNTRASLELAFERFLPHVQGVDLWLSSEHYFDSVVLDRIEEGKALPYPGGCAVLLEFYDCALVPALDATLAALHRRGLRPVIAHPERYPVFWKEPDRLDRLLDVGAAALLDAMALVGHYGRVPQRTAEHILDRGGYIAACSDAHRPKDVSVLARAVDVIRTRYGADEVEVLFESGPREILQGALHASC